MSGVSVSHAIMFIASIVVAAAVAGVLVGGVSNISNAIDDRTDATSEQIETDYTIVSDPNAEEELTELNQDAPDRIQFVMKNIGSNDLIAADGQITVLVDGRLAENIDFIPEGNQVWEQSSTLTLRIEETTQGELDLDEGEDVSIHVDINGHEESFQFRVKE